MSNGCARDFMNTKLSMNSSMVMPAEHCVVLLYSKPEPIDSQANRNDAASIVAHEVLHFRAYGINVLHRHPRCCKKTRQLGTKIFDLTCHRKINAPRRSVCDASEATCCLLHCEMHDMLDIRFLGS